MFWFDGWSSEAFVSPRYPGGRAAILEAVEAEDLENYICQSWGVTGWSSVAAFTMAHGGTPGNSFLPFFLKKKKYSRMIHAWFLLGAPTHAASNEAGLSDAAKIAIIKHMNQDHEVCLIFVFYDKISHLASRINWNCSANIYLQILLTDPEYLNLQRWFRWIQLASTSAPHMKMGYCLWIAIFHC